MVVVASTEIINCLVSHLSFQAIKAIGQIVTQPWKLKDFSLLLFLRKFQYMYWILFSIFEKYGTVGKTVTKKKFWIYLFLSYTQ